jgi:hypothetical protein
MRNEPVALESTLASTWTVAFSDFTFLAVTFKIAWPDTELS